MAFDLRNGLSCFIGTHTEFGPVRADIFGGTAEFRRCGIDSHSGLVQISRGERLVHVKRDRLSRALVLIHGDRTTLFGIRAYGPIYRAMGMTSERRQQWEHAYGMDSLGLSPKGEIFLPGFPVFSKVAWMYIDPIVLTPSETSDLADECRRALLSTNDSAAIGELKRIGALAEEAVTRSSVVEFGHP